MIIYRLFPSIISVPKSDILNNWFLWKTHDPLKMNNIKSAKNGESFFIEIFSVYLFKWQL